MNRWYKWIILIIIGSSILIFASFDSSSADIRTPSSVYSMPSLVLYGGYFALGIGIVGFIQELRKNGKHKKKT